MLTKLIGRYLRTTSRRERITALVVFVATMVGALALWMGGAFDDEWTRADQCHNDVMHYWNRAEFKPMEPLGAFDGLSEDEHYIFARSRSHKWEPATEYVREACEELHSDA